MTRTTSPPKGWHSRCYLPHLDIPGLLQFVTFRLADALPRKAVEQLCAGLEPESPERLRRIEQWLDSGHGACWLRQPPIARLVEDALLHFDGIRYRLLSWVVMPNHLHLLVETQPGHPLPGLVHSWKSYTAKRANALLGRSGEFWARDYFDRYVRDEAHRAAVVAYIENNPVKAGLVERPEQWAYCSAARHDPT